MNDARQLALAAEIIAARDSTAFADVRFCSRPLPSRLSPIVVCVLKNEIARIRDFLRHYRGAGAERFAIIDNGSVDGTYELLADERDVDLFRIRGSFHWTKKQGWINALFAHYGFERWYACVDADEHIVYDGFEARGLGELAQAMERLGLRRVRGFLLDMYTDGPLLNSSYAADRMLIEAYPYFDARGYRESRQSESLSVAGGPRLRAFGRLDERFRPELTKYPIFRIGPDECMVSPHYLWPLEENFASPRYLAILHFKFLPDLSIRIRRAIEEKNYWSDSLEYRCYAQALEFDIDLSLHEEISAKYSTASDLATRGLIAPIAWPARPPALVAAEKAFRLRRAQMQSTRGGPVPSSTTNAAGPRDEDRTVAIEPPSKENALGARAAEDENSGFLR